MKRNIGPDTRIVYGAGCTWWDSIDKVSKNDVGLPCCPYCGGVLFEVSDIRTWLRGIEDYAADGQPGYREKMHWARGKCFKTMADLEAAYAVEAKP